MFYEKNRFREGDEGSIKQTLSLRNQKLIVDHFQNDASEEPFSGGKSQPFASFLHRNLRLVHKPNQTIVIQKDKTFSQRNPREKERTEELHVKLTVETFLGRKIEDSMEAAAEERCRKEAFRQGCAMQQWLVPFAGRERSHKAMHDIRDRNGRPGKTKPHFTHKQKYLFGFSTNDAMVYDSKRR